MGCDVGYGGADCSQPVCPDCENGDCGDAATCLCQIGWEGPTCGDKACDSECQSNGGKCRNGNCLCPTGFIGLQCEAKVDMCPNDCSGNGVCDEFAKHCRCNEGFSGLDCSVA